LGDRGLLAGWLLRQREAVQIVELDALWRPNDSAMCWAAPVPVANLLQRSGLLSGVTALPRPGVAAW